MTSYLLVPTILLAFLAIICERNTKLNLAVKTILVLMSVWGIIEYGIAAGYILKLR